MPGIAASALHAFMRSAYGVMRERPAEVGGGARLLVGGLPGALPGDGRRAGHRRPGEKCSSPEAGRGVPSHRAGARPALALHARDGEDAGVSGRWSIGCGSDRTRSVACRRRRSRSMPARMDFCALHALTGSHWLRMSLARAARPEAGAPLFLAGDRQRFIQRSGSRTFPAAEQLEEWRRAPMPDWPEIKAAAVQMRRRARHQPGLLRLRGVEGLWRPALPVSSPRDASG